MIFQPFARQETVRLTMGQALIKFLQMQFTEYDGEVQRFIPAIWGIFGHGNVSGLSQALWEYGDDLPYYQPTNEQSMVHAASGFSRTRLRMQTFACTTSIGPGATNMVTGAATAHINRLPVLLLPSDYYATRFQGQVLQDIEHPVSLDMSVTDCFRVVSQFFDRITRPEQILYALPEAMRVMTDPVDAGPATVALPQDIQSVAFDYPVNFSARKSGASKGANPISGGYKKPWNCSSPLKNPTYWRAAAFTIPRHGKNYASFPTNSAFR